MCAPLQQFYQFENFFSMPLTDKDIEAKPFVLLIGQVGVPCGCEDSRIRNTQTDRNSSVT